MANHPSRAKRPCFVTRYNGAFKQVQVFDADEHTWTCEINGQQRVGHIWPPDGLSLGCLASPDDIKNAEFIPL